MGGDEDQMEVIRGIKIRDKQKYRLSGRRYFEIRQNNNDFHNELPVMDVIYSMKSDTGCSQQDEMSYIGANGARGIHSTESQSAHMLQTMLAHMINVNQNDIRDIREGWYVP